MQKTNWNRRAVLKSLGLAAIGTPLTAKAISSEREGRLITFREKKKIKPGKPVKVIVVGAGSRGWGAYSSYGLKFPKELQVVGVAEPDSVGLVLLNGFGGAFGVEA